MEVCGVSGRVRGYRGGIEEGDGVVGEEGEV
jgi:hypothetical protein